MKKTNQTLATWFKMAVHWIMSVWESPEKVFLVLASFFGVVMVFLMPLFVVPDEAVHFKRAYQVGGGHFISQTVNGETGGLAPEVPTSQAVNGILPPPLAWHDYFKSMPAASVHFVPFPSSALYSPVPYLPQAIGIDAGRVIHSSFGSMVLLGRLCNLAAFIALVYAAIRIARQGKWVYAAAALFPVAIQEAASLSTDVMTIGLAFVTIALIHNLFLQRHTITKKQYLTLVLLAVGLGLTKQTNLILLLPLILLPKAVLGSFWRRIGLAASIIGAGFLVAVAWYATITLSHYDLDYANALGIGHIDQAAQLQYIISHPVSFIETLFRTYVFEGFKGFALPDFFWASMYGYFSVFLYKLPIPFIALGYTTLLLALLYRGADRQVPFKVLRWQGSVQLLTFVLSAIAIAVALYMIWTPIGSPQVSGIQGRYLIPLLPLLIPVFALLSRWVRVSFDKPYRLGMLVSAVAAINLSAMALLTQRYFF